MRVFHDHECYFINGKELHPNGTDPVLYLFRDFCLHHFEVSSERKSQLLLESEGLEHLEVEIMLGFAGLIQKQVVHLESEVKDSASAVSFHVPNL